MPGVKGLNESEGEEMDQETAEKMDEESCDKRRNECLQQMAELERQFVHMKEQLYEERSSQVELRLEEVKIGVALEYTQPLEELHQNLKNRLEVSDILKELRLVNIKHIHEAENQASKQNLESEKALLWDSIKCDLEDKIRRLEEDRNSVDITSDLWNEQVNHKRNKRKADPHSLGKRKKPVTVSGPYIVYMLHENDILEDWTTIRKALKASKQSSEYEFSAPERISARFADGKLLFKGDSFRKGETVFVDDKIEKPWLAHVISVNTSEVLLQKTDGTWARIGIMYGNTLNTLISAYVAACDKQGIKPLSCVLDQLQEYQSSSHKLEANPRAFDLSILGEKLSLKHCEALEEVLRRLQFQLIDLEGCYLEDEGAAAFFDMIEYYDSAVQLNISFTKHIDCRGWQACSRMLKKTASLVSMNARSTGLNEQVLLIIGRALRLGSNLVTLHLENCGIFGRCLVILVAALKLNTTLRELFLAENKISSADGFQLGNLLRTNTHLELLDLSNNKLGDEGLTHVMDSLGQQSNTSGRGLYTLILWNNELTVKGMPCVSRALTAARALRRFNMGSNAITSAGILELKQSFICNRTIEILELENAKITSEGATALAEYISQNQFIQKLDIRGNDIRLNGLTALSEAVMKNPNIVSLKIDPTSLDLSEPIKDRQERLQEISKGCQRNKEAKSNLPPQDAQLSFLFNGIFSHVLPTTVSRDISPKGDSPPKARKGRFQVSVVVQDNLTSAAKSPSDVARSMSLDTSYLSFGTHDLVGQMTKDNASDRSRRQSVNIPNSLHLEPLKIDTSNDLMDKSVKNNQSDSLVMDRVKWLEGLETANEEMCTTCSCKDSENSEVFLSNDEIRANLSKKGLTLSLNEITGDVPEIEPKVRRSSSPTISSAPIVCRKTHRIKCCKELEGLDLRTTVPLSPTRLHESFDFPETQVTEVPLNSQMNMKSSHAVYMVH
ncbi:Protein phosphatase 1 regulatory subunit 37 like protein [Argiope bruennichi]|uniref:Protein phosphatase 1 regulatory subunit 37 like protein n=1 Tax=Argiope bruennichi TaxID=94029 RepID=A0A8T0ERL0_ARGBR|nr:Protein phosphatase 1 regulatory subunit 37 like protein [Argiope bruennichi]